MDMDREEALRLLRGGEEGIKKWNQWRSEDGGIPDLMKVDLRNANLNRAELSSAHLRGANLTGAKLVEANLCQADLSGANLDEADLRRTRLRHAILSKAYVRHANLHNTRLLGADFTGARLDNSDLHGAHLVDANFTQAKSQQRVTRGAWSIPNASDIAFDPARGSPKSKASPNEPRDHSNPVRLVSWARVMRGGSGRTRRRETVSCVAGTCTACWGTSARTKLTTGMGWCRGC